MKASSTTVIALVTGIALGALCAHTLQAQPKQIERKQVLKTDLMGLGGKEGLILTATIPVGEHGGKHYHPGHELTYVIEGAGVLMIDGRLPMELKAGDAVYLPPGAIHDAKSTGSVPLKVVAFWIAEKGKPYTVPVP